MIYLCATPQRPRKTGMLMHALYDGIPGGKRVIWGPPPDDNIPFIVWGQMWLALELLPPAIASGRPFWHIDNGFCFPGRGSTLGYYRMTYRGLSPVLLQDPYLARPKPQSKHRACEPTVKPWRKDGKHVLIAMPGPDFGRALGMNMRQWILDIRSRVRANTDRLIVVRQKNSSKPLASELENCWALVTHSSNVAVDAVLAGVPVFVEPTSPAAPVGRLDLNIEEPVMPDRDHWLRSLMAQQFTVAEMKNGTAYHAMRYVAEQVDGPTPTMDDACQLLLS